MRPGRPVGILVAVPVSRRLLTALLVLVALALAVPAATLAAGGGSAGDQQYTDPFAATSTPTSTHTATPTTTPPAPATTAPPPTVATSTQPLAPAATATPAATTPAPATPEPTATTARPTTLPFTGYDSWLAGALGMAMVVGGITLRRRARRA
jgi:hypothetical protein